MISVRIFWYVGKYGRYIITGIYHHVISLQQFLY